MLMSEKNSRDNINFRAFLYTIRQNNNEFINKDPNKQKQHIFTIN